MTKKKKKKKKKKKNQIQGEQMLNGVSYKS